MKEKIYTIPISDAFASPCLCPFCTIKNQIEASFVESAVGASMMEPDIRIKTNEMGFCNDHYAKLKEQKKALPLALILQTHLKDVADKTFNHAIPLKKKTLFGEKSNNKSAAAALIEKLEHHGGSCYICNRINETMDRFIENTIGMWESEPDFKEVFRQTPSFCMLHFSMLLKSGMKLIHTKKFDEFYVILCDIEKKAIDDLYQDVTSFANSFDYRNSEPLSKKVKSAVKRAIELLY